MTTFRQPGDSKEEFLYRLYNTGATDLRLCYNYVQDDELKFTRWVRYDHLMTLNPEEWVVGTKDNKASFLRKATHRTIHPLEVVYDVDVCTIDSKPRSTGLDLSGKKLIVHRYFTYPNIISMSTAIAFRLEKTYLKKVYFTGNKSYHIHQYRPDFAKLRQRDRELAREVLLSKHGCDIAKKSENSMIAIEQEPHYRSGKPKNEVMLL